MIARRIMFSALLCLAPTARAQTDVQLRYTCKDFVERTLHDPRSAELDWTAGKVTRGQANRSTVRFPGRAKNAYGALVRSTFECVIEYQGNDNFRAISVRAL